MLPYTVHTVQEAVWVIPYLPFIVAPLFALMAGSLPPTRDHRRAPEGSAAWPAAENYVNRVHRFLRGLVRSRARSTETLESAKECAETVVLRWYAPEKHRWRRQPGERRHRTSPGLWPNSSLKARLKLPACDSGHASRASAQRLYAGSRAPPAARDGGRFPKTCACGRRDGRRRCRPVGRACRRRWGAIDVGRNERVRRVIRKHLRTPTFRPSILYRLVGMSRSNLYRLFEDTGGVARYIQRERLLEAHAVLTDPASTQSISSVVDDLCFADASSYMCPLMQEFLSERREKGHFRGYLDRGPGTCS